MFFLAIVPESIADTDIEGAGSTTFLHPLAYCRGINDQYAFV